MKKRRNRYRYVYIYREQQGARENPNPKVWIRPSTTFFFFNRNAQLVTNMVTLIQ